MSERNEYDIPRIILGSVKYPHYENIPPYHPLKKGDELVQIIKRCYDAGTKAFLFYLYNKEIVDLANSIAKEEPDMGQMFIVKYDNTDRIISLLKSLKKKPLALFLSAEIADQRDPDLIQRFKNALKKHTKHIGIYSREPIGTVSQMITSTEDIKFFLIPFNLLGYGVQNRALLEMIINSSENCYISINPVADGKLKTRLAMEYIASHNCYGILVDLEDEDIMLETIKFGRYFLETKDFLQIALEFEDLTEVCEYCGIGMERYYPPSKTGGSYFYCPTCGNTKQATEVTYESESESESKE
ncbi:MAG: hypothetical protein ACTSQE_01140 [Candidatus Heimdallarchaeaceae archaeon]